MNVCETTDFLYPMKADIYYPLITQNKYGQAQKEWVFDRTITCNATPVGGAGEEDLKPEIIMQYQNKLVGRVKSDPRISSNGEQNAISNILIVNIRNSGDSLIYRETAGPRIGRGTIYEVATVDPFTGPFQNIEYYKLVLRRTESQEVAD
jgi:hypothetical protein